MFRCEAARSLPPSLINFEANTACSILTTIVSGCVVKYSFSLKQKGDSKQYYYNITTLELLIYQTSIIYLIVSNCGSLPGLDKVAFFVCQRSFANVVRLMVRDSTGQDNSRASINWQGVHILLGSKS